MVEQGSDFLEDERSIGVTDHAREKYGRLSEVEARGLGVDISHLTVDEVQQEERLDMCQGQAGTIDGILEFLQMIHQLGNDAADGIGGIDEVCALLVGTAQERQRVVGPLLVCGSDFDGRDIARQ